MTTTVPVAVLLVVAFAGTACEPDRATQDTEETDVAQSGAEDQAAIDAVESHDLEATEKDSSSLQKILRTAPPAPMPYEEPRHDPGTGTRPADPDPGDFSPGYDPGAGPQRLGPTDVSATDLVAVSGDLRLEVEAVSTRLTAALRASDADQLIDLLAENVILLPAVGRHWRGIEELRRRRPLAGLEIQSLSRTSTDYLESGPHVIEVGSFSMVHKTSDSEPVSVRGEYLVVYARQADGTLAVAMAIWNSAL